MYNILKQISNTTLNHLACKDFGSMVVTNTGSSDVKFSLACGRHGLTSDNTGLKNTGSLHGDTTITDINKGCYILKGIVVPVGCSLNLGRMNCMNFYNELPEEKTFDGGNKKTYRRKTRDETASFGSKNLVAGSKKRWKFFGQINSGSVNIIISK